MAKDTNYVSETTKFIKNYVEKHPGIAEQRAKVYKTWWDDDGIDQEEQNEYKDSKVKLDAYAYFSYPTGK
ncbi:MAG: hypothetical protein K0R94_320 [Burkholderiales bacterium]|jgi:hypothetical protein|nr:hypothetical protein [Burkholderiales bacterium]